MTKKQVLLCLLPVLLIISVIIAVCAFLFGNQANNKETTLVFSSDLHYLSPELTDGGPFFQDLIRRADGKVMEYCEEVTDAFLQQVIDQKPEALILAGDLTFNGARLSHEGLSRKLAKVEEAGIPVLVIPGNHDLRNPSAAAFRGGEYHLTYSIDETEFEEVYGDFGYNEAVSRDPHSLSYLAEIRPGLQVLMVDANTPEYPGSVKEETLTWAQEQLKNAKRKGISVVAVSHQTLLKHNPLFAYGIVMGNGDALLKLYEDYNVICNLSGHMHIQHIIKSDNGFPDVAGSCLMEAPNQYGVLTLHKKGDAYAEYRTQRVNVPDKEGVNINEYAEEFLLDNAYRQGLANFEDISSEEEEMARFYADVNTKYVAGIVNPGSWRVDLAENWKARSILVYSYLELLKQEGPADYRTDTFPIKK